MHSIFPVAIIFIGVACVIKGAYDLLYNDNEGLARYLFVMYLGFGFLSIVIGKSEIVDSVVANSTNSQVEIMKQFYDGQPVTLSEAFWVLDYNMPERELAIKTLAKKYNLDEREVSARVNNFNKQYLIYFPQEPTPVSMVEAKAVEP
ncbi:MAG: hypothetical protein Q7K65_02970 [Candidatus Buchananbacteria bacterium]|nr:hypothetical protein [Candidatus Buchananbacteria bacterium]